MSHRPANRNPIRHLAFAWGLATLAAWWPPAAAQGYDARVCGRMNMGYGPFDFRKSTVAERELVEKFHFTPKVEALMEGATTMKSELGADIAYLLHAFPNHPRGLLSMWRLSDQRKLDPPPRVQFTVACYFERGLNMAKDDTVVRALYASFLASRGLRPEALVQLKIAADFAADNPISNHNIGLVYLELKETELALQLAHKALRLGMVNSRLEERLKVDGLWKDPAP